MHAVSVRIVAPAAFECKFWIDGNGWHAVVDGLEISEQGVQRPSQSQQEREVRNGETENSTVSSIAWWRRP